MKRLIKTLCTLILILALLPIHGLSAPPSNLTWDAQPTSIADIASYIGYDMLNADGSYKPMYYYFAKILWEDGLFLGSDGSFDLDNPLTRTEGIIMTIRILGKEAEAKATTAEIPFEDVPNWAKPYVSFAYHNGITNGYSEKVFGSTDPMTAAQFLTLCLRAMGYLDNVDFTWDKSYDKALAIGLIGEGCHTQYSRSNLFLRDNAAVISYSAIYQAMTKSGEYLKNVIAMPGKPSGTVPSAVRVPTDPVDPKPTDPVEPTPPIGDNYTDFLVPRYENINPTATFTVDKQESDKLYLRYTDTSGEGYKSSDYQALLKAFGFYSKGTVNFESKTLKWYGSDNMQIVFGEVKNGFVLRMYAGEVDSTSANGFRAFYYIITAR